MAFHPATARPRHTAWASHRTAHTGSIIIVTINAHRNRLPTHDTNDIEYGSFAARLRALAGDLVPQKIPKKAQQTSGYPPYLASIIFEQIRRQLLKSGRKEKEITPLFNFSYSDNAPMITMGGVISSNDLATEISVLLEGKNLGKFLDEKHQMKIGVPPLTMKEKAVLDQLLPSIEVPTNETVEGLGFKLKPSQIKAYHEFYRYYPIYGELMG
ncbi:MAG: hypothetical protein ACI9JL_003722 [Paracoccaceae bacterium]